MARGVEVFTKAEKPNRKTQYEDASQKMQAANICS
jgi:hypothetical protein